MVERAAVDAAIPAQQPGIEVQHGWHGQLLPQAALEVQHHFMGAWLVILRG